MPVYRVSGEAKVLELMLKTVASGIDAGPVKCAWRGADVLVSVSRATQLGSLWSDFEIPELTGKQIMLDPSVQAVREYKTVSEAVGVRLKQALIPRRESAPHSVIVSIGLINEWREAISEALEFRVPEISYLPQAISGRIFVRLLKPPAFLLRRWLRRGFRIFTPAEGTNIYVSWGWTLSLPWIRLPSGKILIVDEKGNYAVLPDEFSDVHSILKITMDGAQEWKPEPVTVGPLEVPLRLTPGQTLSDPSLWQASPEKVLAVLSTAPQRLLRMMSVGRFRGEPHGEVWILDYRGAPHPRLFQEINRLTRPDGIAFSTIGVPWLYVPIGYTLQPLPSVKTLNETFLGDETGYTDLILLMPSEGPLNVVRLSLKGFLPAEEVLRYSVEREVCALKEYHEALSAHPPELAEFVKLLQQPPPFWLQLFRRFRRAKPSRGTPE